MPEGPCIRQFQDAPADRAVDQQRRHESRQKGDEPGADGDRGISLRQGEAGEKDDTGHLDDDQGDADQQAEFPVEQDSSSAWQSGRSACGISARTPLQPSPGAPAAAPSRDARSRTRGLGVEPGSPESVPRRLRRGAFSGRSLGCCPSRWRPRGPRCDPRHCPHRDEPLRRVHPRSPVQREVIGSVGRVDVARVGEQAPMIRRRHRVSGNPEPSAGAVVHQLGVPAFPLVPCRWLVASVRDCCRSMPCLATEQSEKFGRAQPAAGADERAVILVAGIGEIGDGAHVPARSGASGSSSIHQRNSALPACRLLPGISL